MHCPQVPKSCSSSDTLILGILWKCTCFEYHLTFVDVQGWSGFTGQSVECFLVRLFCRAATERQASGNNFAHIPNTKVELKSSFSLDIFSVCFYFLLLIKKWLCESHDSNSRSFSTPALKHASFHNSPSSTLQQVYDKLGDQKAELEGKGSKLLIRAKELLEDHTPKPSILHGDLWVRSVKPS